MKLIKDNTIKVDTIKDIVLDGDDNLNLDGFYFIDKDVLLKNYKIKTLFISKDFIGQRNRRYTEDYFTLSDHLHEYPDLGKYRKVLPLDLRDSNIENIIVDKDNKFFSIDADKNLFYKALQYEFDNNNELYLKECVNFIAYLSKNYSKLSTIKIPDGVDGIYKYAFTFIEDKFTCLDLNDVVTIEDDKESPLSNKCTNLKKVFAKNLKSIYYYKGTSYHKSCFENSYIVAPKISFYKLPLFYMLRLVHGYLLHKELYNEDEVTKYEEVLKKIKGKLIGYARFYNYPEILDKLNLSKDKALNAEIKYIKKLSKRQATLDLEMAICTNDITYIDLLLDNVCEFEMPSRALALASRLLPFTVVKKLLDKGFRYNRDINAPLDTSYVIKNTSDYKVFNTYGRVYGSKKIMANNLFIMLASNLHNYPFMLGSFDGLNIKESYDIHEVLKIIDYLYAHKLESDESFQDLLLAAALFDNILIIKHLISIGISLNEEKKLYLNNKNSPIWFKEYYDKAFKNGLGIIGLSYLHSYIFKKNLSFKVKSVYYDFFDNFKSDKDLINFLEIIANNCVFSKRNIEKILTNYLQYNSDLKRFFIVLEYLKDIIIKTKSNLTPLIDYIQNAEDKARFLEYLSTLNSLQDNKAKSNLTL